MNDFSFPQAFEGFLLLFLRLSRASFFFSSGSGGPPGQYLHGWGCYCCCKCKILDARAKCWTNIRWLKYYIHFRCVCVCISNILKSFRLWVQRWQVRRSLRRRLGEEWRPLLLLGNRQEELDRSWGLLPEGGRPFGLCHLERHQRLCRGGDKQNRPGQCLDGRERHRGGGDVEVDRLHSLGSYILGIKTARQQQRKWKLLGTSPQVEVRWKEGLESPVEWWALQLQKWICVQQKDLLR